MIRNAKALFAVLTPRERRNALVVMVVLTGMATLELAGVASIMPFLTVAGQPDVVTEPGYLKALYLWTGLETPRAFMILLGVATLCVLIGSAVYRAVAQYAILRYSNMRRHSIGRRLLASHLRQPYEFFIQRNTSQLSTTILSEVDQLIGQVLAPILQLFAFGLVAVAIIGFLTYMDPWIALVVGGGLIAAYGTIYAVLRGWLRRFGKERAETNRRRFKVTSEVLDGVKEIKIRGTEAAYLKDFDKASERFSRLQAFNKTAAQIPRFFVEGVTFAAIMGVALYVLGRHDNVGQAIPTLGVYAFGTMRLLPALQQLYAAFSKLRFGAAALESVTSDLEGTKGVEPKAGVEQAKQAAKGVHLRQELELDEVTYTYPGASRPALDGLSMTVDARSVVGIVGRTGAGKSTLVDVILGLLIPQAGAVRVDGEALDETNVGAWQRQIGYVPQSIFLADDTVAANIAFGQRRDRIDMERVRECARIACLAEFVEQELPEGYDTSVGQGGSRLSGGQRQRVGIARALYGDPEILVLDEATSALDDATEATVMDRLHAGATQRTVIMIAHRIRSLRACDWIAELEDGRLARTTSHAELAQR